MNTHSRAPGASISAIFASPFGPRPVLDNPERMGAAEVIERINTNHTETKGLLDKTDKKTDGLSSRLTEVEQKMAARMHFRTGSSPEVKSFGAQVVESDEFKAFVDSKRPASARIEIKNVTSATAAGLLVPDYQPAVTAPKRTLTIRNLIAPGRTDKGSIIVPLPSTRTNNASTVAENPAAAKPQSDYGWNPATIPVRTIAHWVKASKQIMDDVPQLRSMIDIEMLYGLKFNEEVQLLTGDGTGTNISGIMTNATNFAIPQGLTIANPNKMDTLLQALAQVDLALFPADGIVLNTVDWYSILALKDTMGRYLAGGPLAAIAEALWQIPRVVTPVMPQGYFLVGSFQQGAQLFDREEANVVLSTEDQDNFVRNMVTILAEERLALLIKQPTAFVKGTFTS